MIIVHGDVLTLLPLYVITLFWSRYVAQTQYPTPIVCEVTLNSAWEIPTYVLFQRDYNSIDVFRVW